MPITKETALNQIDGWLGVRVISLSDIAAKFDMMPKMTGVDLANDNDIPRDGDVLWTHTGNFILISISIHEAINYRKTGLSINDASVR